MIHTNQGDTAPFAPGEDNPFYLLCDSTPLPLAVKQGVPEAVAFRDGWELASTLAQRRAYFFDPLTRVWVGGAEDGAVAVARAAQGG